MQDDKFSENSFEFIAFFYNLSSRINLKATALPAKFEFPRLHRWRDRVDLLTNHPMPIISGFPFPTINELYLFLQPDLNLKISSGEATGLLLKGKPYPRGGLS
jgi:hypothetical protein